jgi:hypothetical protein
MDKNGQLRNSRFSQVVIGAIEHQFTQRPPQQGISTIENLPCG